MQIRGDAAEIPYPVGLEDALAILLAILDRKPASYSKGAARWASRLALKHKLTLADAQLALAALACRRRRVPGRGGADRRGLTVGASWGRRAAW